MIQGELFSSLPAAPPPAWIRVDGIAGKVGALVHSSGWSVVHCGHPTANYPYTLQDPRGRLLVAQNGRGFRTAALGKAAIEAILAGIAVISSHTPKRVLL